MTTRTDVEKKAGAAYVLGFFITGLGHMYIGKIARGVAFLIGAFAVSFAGTWFFGWYSLVLVSLPYSVISLLDLRKTVKAMEVTENTKM